MKTKTILASIFCLVALIQAAPYCAVFSHGKQCFYFSWDECKRAAGSQGACTINEKEAKKPQGNAPFCLVASYGTQCFYYDMSQCEKAAKTANAVCTVNPD